MDCGRGLDAHGLLPDRSFLAGARSLSHGRDGRFHPAGLRARPLSGLAPELRRYIDVRSMILSDGHARPSSGQRARWRRRRRGCIERMAFEYNARSRASECGTMAAIDARLGLSTHHSAQRGRVWSTPKMGQRRRLPH
jgi:hypothetical protein